MKDKFIRALINELNDVNERERAYHNKPLLDVCFIVSVIDQQIENCKEFMDELKLDRWHINGYDEDFSGGYTNGKIRILIEKPEEEKESDLMVDSFEDYCYYLEFTHDDRHWGYCQCLPDDNGFNEKYNCCGNGCDWSAPSFTIYKEIYLGGGTWKGNESDYWKYEEQFNRNSENKNEEVEQYKKQQEKERIEKQIKELQLKLEELK